MVTGHHHGKSLFRLWFLLLSLPLPVIAEGLLFMKGVAQPVTIAGEFSSGGTAPNDEFLLTLFTDEPADLYFLGLEIAFDPLQIDFVSVRNTGLTDEGIHVSGETGSGRAGVAVSRTGGGISVQDGAFMELVFRVRATADAGGGLVTFSDVRMNDSEGEPVEVSGPGEIAYTVAEGIGVAELSVPEQNLVTQGDPFGVAARVYASGITTEEGNTDRLSVGAGVSPEDTPPEGWGEEVWQEMEPGAAADGYYSYSAEAALFRDPGSYFLALRVSLDGGGYVYGGVNGFWDGADHPSALLEISRPPAFRYDVARWDFADGLLVPSRSIPVNDQAEIQVSGASLSGDDPPDTQTSGGVTYLNTRGWQPEEEPGGKYIRIAVSTIQLEDVQLSSSHTGTQSGPRFFQVQVSPDGESWEDLPGGGIDLAETDPVHLSSLPLPPDYDDREILYIRWLNTGEERIDGTGAIAAIGVHRIGDIRLSAVNAEPQTTQVLPGDTDRDGEVGVLDVLEIGYFWQSRGPKPVYDFIRFEPREVEAWIPQAATYADADGDGVVSQNDLLPVGLHYGKTDPAAKTQKREEPVAQAGSRPGERIDLPAAKRGEEFLIEVASPDPERIRGLALRITLEGVPETFWNVVPDQPPEWAAVWKEENRLLEFRKKSGRFFEEALVLKGRGGSTTTEELTRVRLEALQDWVQPARLSVERLAVSRTDGAVESLAGLEVNVAAGPGSEGENPARVQLEQNYPNPFEAVTTLLYRNQAEQQVRLQVFDVTGRKVATLVDERQPSGTYTVRFDAGGMAGGVYFYRLQAGGKRIVRSMVLVR